VTDSATSPANAAANAAKLEKQLRVLQRKLERSEWHRVDLENQHDRDQHLYRRLQADLEAAQREAQIQLALERVRTQSMLMQHSSELVATSAIFHEQLVALGIPTEFSYVWLPDEAAGKHQFWATWTTEEDGEVVHRSKAITYDLDKSEPYTAACFAAWESDERLLVDFIPPPDIAHYLGIWEELFCNAEHLRPERFPDGLYYVEAYMDYGCFGINMRRESTEPEQGVLQRFAIEFERAYTRFLDLRRAEAQAREAEIEAALERVRSRTMGMQKSEELQEIIKVVHDHITDIGIHADHAGFIIDYKNRDDMHIILVDDQNDVPSEVFIPYFDSPHWNSFRNAKAKGEGQFTNDLDFDEKNRFYEQLIELIPGVPDETREFLLSCPGLSVSTVLLDNVGLYIENFSARHYTDEENRTLLRFGTVFQQAYTRFLDIQAAELQAREAERQAALDRVRAEIASTLTSDADVTAATFDALEAEIRTLTGRSGLRLGLATLQADGELNARPERRIWNSLLIRDALRDGALDWRGTLYGTAMQSAEPLAVSDVESDDSLDEGLRELLLSQGVRSLALQPLRTADRTVGLFELSSSEAGAVDDTTLLTMTRLEPTFALAVTQNLEGFETRVESAIQHAYTAIHPSVRWRFRDAAIEMLERGDDTVEPEPVVFEAVHPLYGAADIRASTHHRNEAVRHDVLGRLGRARDALASVHEALPLTILDELGLRVRKRIDQYERAWNAGDEAAADRFLTEDVEPVLERMTAGRADLVSVLEACRSRGEEGAALRSDAYEASRRAINRAVSDVLLAEEAETQRLFPHYLELTRTDGVEHTMYIGPSIAPDRPFDLAYVENLRLRQLIAACAVAREVRRLGETLPMPLAIAQLVVVQHAPITLRFRADEKRFDVDSPSGVRFELLKKRLDKAHVKGTDERITQPDRIAVVYSIEAEEAEYRRYAEYLAAQGQIESEPEMLDVEDLPDAAGLKMLRLKVSSSGS
jgi:hypothetical protein